MPDWLALAIVIPIGIWALCLFISLGQGYDDDVSDD